MQTQSIFFLFCFSYPDEYRTPLKCIISGNFTLEENLIKFLSLRTLVVFSMRWPWKVGIKRLFQEVTGRVGVPLVAKLLRSAPPPPTAPPFHFGPHILVSPSPKPPLRLCLQATHHFTGPFPPLVFSRCRRIPATAPPGRFMRLRPNSSPSRGSLSHTVPYNGAGMSKWLVQFYCYIKVYSTKIFYFSSLSRNWIK